MKRNTQKEEYQLFLYGGIVRDLKKILHISKEFLWVEMKNIEEHI